MYSNIQELLSQEDTEGAIQHVKHVGNNKDFTQLNMLIELLKSTENDALRNEIAVAFVELGDERLVEPLIEVILDLKTWGKRETLLSSLAKLDYILHIEHIIPYIGDPNLEVSAQALMLLEQLKDRLSNQQIHNCLEIMEYQIKHNESKLLVVASEMFKRWR